MDIPKKYHVFVSSTYRDLKKERSAIIEAIHQAEHIPVGVESLAVETEPATEVIRRAIDASDIFVLLSGTRLGTISEEGRSFTEIELDYAESIGIPILIFALNDEEFERERRKMSESDPDEMKAAEILRFRKELTHKRFYKPFSKKDLRELKGSFLSSLNQLIHRSEDISKPGPSLPLNIDLWIDPGMASAEDLRELFDSLAELHRALDGFGITILDDATKVFIAEEVAS